MGRGRSCRVLLHIRFAGEFKQLGMDVTISVGVLVEIVLMILFGRIEVLELHYLHDYRAVVILGKTVYRVDYDVLLLGVSVVYAGAVLCAFVAALAVERCRINRLEV